MKEMIIMKITTKLALIPGILAAFVLTGAGAVWADQPMDAQTKARIDQFEKGPATIDVSKYPAQMQDDYQLFAQKCSQCHKLSRPINSDYVLPDQWSRYIKRMMYKPGSNISSSEGKKIYQFLVYDSSVRKKKALDDKLQTLTADERNKAQEAIKKVVDSSQ
jgi:hypothetical protein